MKVQIFLDIIFKKLKSLFTIKDFSLAGLYVRRGCRVVMSTTVLSLLFRKTPAATGQLKKRESTLSLEA